MFSWLFGAKCPVDSDRQAWLEQGLNWLGSQFGAQRMLDRPVVLPTSEFFPDPFDGSRRAAESIFNRVCQYMEVNRDRVYLELYVNEGDGIPAHLREGRTTGAAGLYQDEKLGPAIIGIDEARLANPVSLIGAMAHELGHVHLLGDGRLSPDMPDHEPLTDLLTVLYGLGVFTANSVVRESSWSDGHHSGWSVGRQGYLTGPEYGYAFALLTRARHEANPAWASHLRLDVRSALRQGLRYLKSIDESPFTGEVSMLPSLEDEEGVPWTRPRVAKEEDDEDDFPPWAKDKRR